MNINKTNKFGLHVAKYGFRGDGIKSLGVLKNHTKDTVTINKNLVRHNESQKIIRVSKNIIDACKLINIESIIDNINNVNFNFRSMFILLDNDKSGFIKVERLGSDFGFVAMDELNTEFGGFGFCYNSYSFASKSFSVEKEDEQFGEYNYSKSVFAVQLLTYLIFGDITEKLLKPKTKTTIGFNRIVNNSKSNITFCDSLWKQRISTDGFKVSGHFRLQPIGEKRSNSKLIWIEEFKKNGYNRKATVENVK